MRENRGVGRENLLIMKSNRTKKVVEKAAVAALREGDVKKALRILNALPLAPKSDSTFKELVRLHLRVHLQHPLPFFELQPFPRN